MTELERFKLYVIKSGRKKQTAEWHVSLISRLLGVSKNLDLDQINAFLLEMIEQGRKGTYVNAHIDSLRVYGRFIGDDRFTSITYFKEQVFVQATMSDSEIESFLTLPPKTGGEKAITNYNTWTLFFKILAYTGMRPGEVAHLTIDTVDFGRQVFVLEDTKTNTPRYVPISSALTGDLTEHIKKLDGKYLFPSSRRGQYRQGGVVNDVDWGYNFHDRIKRLGIKRKNLRPYSLRPSFITRMLDEDVNIFKVQKIVGHRQISTTAHYTHLTTKDITNAIKKDPLSRLTLPFYDRMKMFRELVRKGLEDHATSSEEEKLLLNDLLNLN